MRWVLVSKAANNAIAFIRVFGLKQVDVLGFSIGGLVAQEITLQSPELVRRLVLVGKAALFLASDDSSFVTGVELFDGGRAQI